MEFLQQITSIRRVCVLSIWKTLCLLLLFLSTPVLMHGGLLCTAFCLSVAGPKFCLDKKSLDQNSEKSLDEINKMN